MKPRDARNVMAGRREPPDSLDFFPTPPWATRALTDALGKMVEPKLNLRVAWDPAAGEGHMVGPLNEAFSYCIASDVFDYGRGYDVLDFLDPGLTVESFGAVDFVVTNPPFNIALQFALRGLEFAREGVALLVRTSWLSGTGRFRDLFDPHPPTFIWQFSERCAMVKGRFDPTASTATDYCWVIWVKGERTRGGVDFRWIPPGAKQRFTRPDDAARYGALADAPLLEGVTA